MTTTAKARTPKAAPPARSRLRREIVDAMRGLHKAGAVSGEELEKTTLRMLGKDALPKVEAMSPAEIAALRERTGISPGGPRRLHERGREHGE